METVQWNTMKFADATFLRALQQMCSESNTLLCVDERNFAPGYHGPTWTHSSSRVTPDLLLGRIPLGNTFEPVDFVAVGSHLEPYASLLGKTVPNHLATTQLDKGALAMQLFDNEATRELVKERGRTLLGLSRSLQAR